MANGWHRKRTTPAEVARRKKYRSAEHRQARARYTVLVAAGQAHCWRCGRTLAPHMPWVVGHDDHQVELIRGPECEPCNRTAANRKGARIANAKRNPPGATRLRW
jgi:hypothetical protein